MSVVDALMNPEVYDEKVLKIVHLQTHISHVFLTGEYVYKIKKPVDFGFLDFTTLAKRKHFCDRELEINRMLCPGIYLDVVPIGRSPSGDIRINSEFETVEYAVKMVQLPQESIMTELLKKGEIYKNDIDKIAGLLADFHSKAETGEGVDVYGSVEQIKANWVQNFDQTQDLRGNLLEESSFDTVKMNVLSFIEDNRELFERRVAEKKIRACHGDVHSGNIFVVREGGRLYSEGIYIFDAIEFNEAFRCGDIASEIAFLSMDMDFHGRDDLSAHLEKRYSEYAGDDIAPLLFYKCYRAYVRSKVSSFRLDDPDITEKEKEEAVALTKRYFELALGYAARL